jgi:hypothetical protein
MQEEYHNEGVNVLTARRKIRRRDTSHRLWTSDDVHQRLARNTKNIFQRDIETVSTSLFLLPGKCAAFGTRLRAEGVVEPSSARRRRVSFLYLVLFFAAGGQPRQCLSIGVTAFPKEMLK